MGCCSLCSMGDSARFDMRRGVVEGVRAGSMACGRSRSGPVALIAVMGDEDGCRNNEGMDVVGGKVRRGLGV